LSTSHIYERSPQTTTADGRSEYEIKRERNIARNKALLKSKWLELVLKLTVFKQILCFSTMLCFTYLPPDTDSQNATQRRLESTSQPEEVHAWLKNGHKHTAIPNIMQVLAYM